jgi:hypothetical protein
MIFNNENLVITSERATGCTSECTMVEGYPPDYSDLNLKIYDTVGIEESNEGTVPTKLALQKFDQLLTSINDGIHILLFCIKMGRLPLTTQTNYQLFFETLCNKQVPCILVITHCDTEYIIGTWWTNNKCIIEKQFSYKIVDAVSVTTIKQTARGASTINDYYNSRKELINSIINNALSQPWNPNKNRNQFYLHLKKIFTNKSNQDFINFIQSFIEAPQPTIFYPYSPTSNELHEQEKHDLSPLDRFSSRSQSSSQVTDDHYHQQIQQNVLTKNIVILIDDYTCSSEVTTTSRSCYQKITNDLTNDFPKISIRSHMGTFKSILQIIHKDIDCDYEDLYPQPGGAVTLIFAHRRKEMHNDINQLKKEIRKIHALVDDLNNRYHKNNNFFITLNPYSLNNKQLKDYNDQLKSLDIRILELDFFSNDSIQATIGPINQDKAKIIYSVLRSAIIKYSTNIDF